MDMAGTALKLAYCDNPVCSTWVTNKVDDVDTGEHPSLQLTTEGLPVIAYQRSGMLYVAFCGTPACEPGTTTVKTLDSRVGINAAHTSMQLDTNGRPIASYSRPASSGFGGMWVAYCNDADCDSVSLNQVEGSAATTYTSLKLNSSGNPVIAYSATVGARLVVCTAPDCSTLDPFVALHATTTTGHYISLQLDTSDRPRAVFFWNSGGIRMALCSDAACSSVSTVTFSGTNTTANTSLALDNSGRPVFTSANPGDASGNQLRLTRCANATCGGSPTSSTLESARIFRSSLVLDCANNPVVAYHRNILSPNTNELRLYVDDSSACATSPAPQFKTSLAAPGPLEFTGAAGSSPQLTIGIRNGVHATQLDVNLVSISSGYNVVSGLPIDDLAANDPAATITIQCNNAPQSSGTLVLSTNDPANPTVSYNLTCGAAPSTSGAEDVSEAGAPSANIPIAASGVTTLQFGRLFVSLPASAIPPGQTGCEVVAKEQSSSGQYGFSLDDIVYDVKVFCDSGELNIFLDALTICIRPSDGVASNKTLHHRHTAAAGFQPLGGGSGPAGYVCGQTRLLSLFTLGQLSLPATGFAPGVVAQLAAQPAELAYAASGLTLSIPKLGLNLDILGVPQGPNGWDVTWLTDHQAGYLHGTAFPTWAGNSVLTAHVWNADNTPGPFHALKTLQHGDRFTIAYGGNTYTYEVRSNQLVLPSSQRPLAKSEYSQITLVTCESFDPATGDYRYRRAVQAVLVDVY